jgi:hypothetical protein
MFLLILSFNFFIRTILSSYDHKHGDKSKCGFQLCIPKLGIEQPIFIFGWYYKNQG